MTDSNSVIAPPVAKQPRGRKAAYHHGNLKPALIEGALTLLEAHGAVELSMRMLARQIGVSQTAPYHHFEDKNALLAALAAEGFKRAAEALRAVSIEHHSLERRIRGICAGYVRFAREKPELFRLMYGTLVQRKEDYPELVAASTEAFEALSRRVEEMVIDFGIAGVVPRQAAVTLLAMNHGLAHLIIDRRISPVLAGVIDDERITIAHAARHFASGLRCRDGDADLASKS